MRKTLIAAAVLSTVGVSAPAVAADSEHSFSGNVTMASEYIYRGIGQTNRKAALQGGFDYSHSSGFYLGTWGSNVSWLADATGANSSLEIDVYGGYRGAVGPIGYDVGVLSYNYPGQDLPTGNADPDTVEVYVGASWEFLSVKYSYSTTSLFGWTTTVGDLETDGSGYIELNAAYDLGDGWGVNAHIGNQDVSGRDSASYTDYKVGVTKDLGFGVVGVSYVGTDAESCIDPIPDYCNAYNKDLGEGRALLTFTKSL